MADKKKEHSCKSLVIVVGCVEWLPGMLKLKESYSQYAYYDEDDCVYKVGYHCWYSNREQVEKHNRGLAVSVKKFEELAEKEIVQESKLEGFSIRDVSLSPKVRVISVNLKEPKSCNGLIKLGDAVIVTIENRGYWCNCLRERGRFNVGDLIHGMGKLVGGIDGGYNLPIYAENLEERAGYIERIKEDIKRLLELRKLWEKCK